MKQVLEADYNEEMVIRAAQAGDREAFASLYEAHVDRVYHYLLRRMGQPADAEDVTAEVFIRAMKALKSFEFRGAPFVAWLLRIAHNTAVNHMKKQSRRQEVPPTFPIWLKSFLSNSSMVFQPLSNYGPFLRVPSYNNSMICHFAVRCRRHHGGT